MIIDFILQNWIFLAILLGSFLAIFLLYLVFNIRTPERPKRPELQPVTKEKIVVEPVQNDSGSSPIEPVIVGGEIVANPITSVEPTADSQSEAPVAAEESQALEPLPNDPQPNEPQTPPEAPQKQKKTLGRYHVLYRSSDDAWIVKREGSDRILRVLETQKDAITFANIKALSNDTQIVIHKKDGKIRKQNYRKDDEA